MFPQIHLWGLDIRFKRRARGVSIAKQTQSKAGPTHQFRSPAWQADELSLLGDISFQETCYPSCWLEP